LAVPTVNKVDVEVFEDAQFVEDFGLHTRWDLCRSHRTRQGQPFLSSEPLTQIVTPSSATSPSFGVSMGRRLGGAHAAGAVLSRILNQYAEQEQRQRESRSHDEDGGHLHEP